MLFAQEIINAVNAVARIDYVDSTLARRWNQQRGENELRLFTGWYWEHKTERRFRQGFKTKSVAYRDAWYELVMETSAPMWRTRPRVVETQKQARKKG